MVRKSKKIEFIKDKVGKFFIKSNSIICENNKSLEDKLNEKKLYMISGTTIVYVNSIVVVVHTWSQIQDKFEATYGFRPSDVTALGIAFTNGDTQASWNTIIGSHMSWDNGYRVVAAFNNSMNGNYRINYAYFYNH